MNTKRVKPMLFGQSLFEVVMALAILAVILTGIVSLTSKSVTTASFSKNKAQANRYASEAIEYLRAQKEFLGWPAFQTAVTASGGVWCMNDLTFTVSGACDPANPSHNIGSSIFQRTLSTQENTDNIDVTVTVSWTDEKGFHETKTVSSISDW